MKLTKFMGLIGSIVLVICDIYMAINVTYFAIKEKEAKWDISPVHFSNVLQLRKILMFPGIEVSRPILLCCSCSGAMLIGD